MGATSKSARLLPLPGRREPCVERRAVGLAEPVRREEDRQPAVGDLRAERDVLRSDRRDVDRDVVARRMHDELERLAEPGRVGTRVRDVVVRAVMLEPLLARQDRAHDLHVLARLAEGLAVRLAVPTLHDLRTGETEPEQEAVAAEEVERHRGHRGHGRRARGHLHDRGAEVDALGVRHHPRDRRDGVGAVRLGGPHRMEAELLRFLGQRHRARQALAPVLIAEVDPESHGCEP